ncbi:MAG: SH3 domain-containing protein [Candidatus Omnitrophica bacterium]|nr:SH3 domain-containing protein [Candidatus Omnitrophota bacterium]
MLKGVLVRVSLLLSLFLILTAGVYADEVIYYHAPSELPYVSPGMNSAGFWIGRHPQADRLVMNFSQVEAFNANNRKEGLVDDLLKFPDKYDGAKLKKEIGDIVESFKWRELYKKDGTKIDESFSAAQVEISNISSIPASVNVRYGFISQWADERLLPTDEVLSVKAADVDFDELQNSGLEPGTPVVILHQDKTGGWLFVKDRVASGWVRAGNVALATKDIFNEHLRRRDSIVVVGARADIYAERERLHFVAAVRMGTRFLYKNTVGRVVEIAFPVRQPDGNVKFVSGFMSADDVSLSPLPLTARVILTQAFKLLGAPYGWGDAHGRQDCSRFIEMVFASVGVEMPRNSAEQGKVGISLAEFDDAVAKEARLKLLNDKALSALTILRLKGHIVLYLGMVNGVPYAIHETWGYREKTPEGERTRVIGRVAVTDLSLGDSSSKGSLLDRIIDVRLIDK